MKKTIAILVVLLLACSMVIAQGPKNEDSGKPDDAGQPEVTAMPVDAPRGTEGAGEPQLIAAAPDETGRPTDAGMHVETGKPADFGQMGAEGPKGLMMALEKVTNENARQRLEQNILRFQEQYQERIAKMEGVELEDVDEETGEVTVKAKEEVRFLGFIKGKATKRFSMDAEGNITEKAPWYRFMYADPNA